MNLKIKITLFLFIIFRVFIVNSQINEEDLKYSITFNRTVWRIDTFLKFKNIDYRISIRDYEKILFKRDESEKFNLKSIDSLETDVFKFYEFSFKYRCSSEGDERTNAILEKEQEFWKNSGSTIRIKDSIISLTDSMLIQDFHKCNCCTVLSGTIRSGSLYGVPNCSGRVGLIAINKEIFEDIYFISGKCVYLSNEFFKVFFQENDINDIQKVKKYILLRFWEGFSTKKYILKVLDKVNEQTINFTIEDKEKNKVSKYSLNLKSGEISENN